MNQTRDCVVIRGRAIRHSTASRDWVCGECGGRLVTRWHEDAPHWRTECIRNGTNDEEHPEDGFIHKDSWAWRESERIKEGMVAQDVFSHLPAEMQAAIDERGE